MGYSVFKKYEKKKLMFFKILDSLENPFVCTQLKKKKNLSRKWSIKRQQCGKSLDKIFATVEENRRKIVGLLLVNLLTCERARSPFYFRSTLWLQRRNLDHALAQNVYSAGWAWQSIFLFSFSFSPASAIWKSVCLGTFPTECKLKIVIVKIYGWEENVLYVYV